MKVPEPRKLPSGVWFIQLRLGGNSIPVTASTEKECRNMAALIKAEHVNGKLTVQKKKIPTLRQAIDDYIESKKDILSPSTIRGYKYIRDNRFASVMDTRLDKINNWQKIVNEESKMISHPELSSPGKESKKLSAKTLQNAVSVVSAAYKFADLPAPKVTLPQHIKKEHYWLRPNQLTEFISSTEGNDYKIPMLLALNGLRRSEILGLTWDNIDLENKIIKIRGSMVFGDDGKLVKKETNKTQKSRRNVPILIPELITELENNYKNDNSSVANCSPNTIYKNVNRICKLNGWDEVGAHGLRHSFASLCYHLNIKEKTCAKWGGWEDEKVLHEIYTHLSEQDEDDDIKKVREFLSLSK